MMAEKYLICKRSTRTWLGTALELEYYLLCECVLDDCAERYGVEIVARSDGAVEHAAVPDLTMAGTKILRLIEMLADGTVTPTGLYDVVQDWL